MPPEELNSKAGFGSLGRGLHTNPIVNIMGLGKKNAAHGGRKRKGIAKCRYERRRKRSSKNICNGKGEQHGDGWNQLHVTYTHALNKVHTYFVLPRVGKYTLT